MVKSAPISLPEEAIENALSLLRNGKLFRYSEHSLETGHASLLEKEFAEYLGVKYCTAVNSGGSALFLAIKSLGVQAGDGILFNSFTLAPVPGAIDHAGAIPIPVNSTESYTIDFDDLRKKAKFTKARVLIISHMRGHICDLYELSSICEKLNLTLIEDCAHTMEGMWNNKYTGTFGAVGCFSTQSFKHINSGEGGILVTNDPDISAKSILFSGSYALYEQHLARPCNEVFSSYYGKIPNYSLRMSDLIASIIRPQISLLSKRKIKWNYLYELLEMKINSIPGVIVPSRNSEEGYVGSSIQFKIMGIGTHGCERLVAYFSKHGFQLKWFGNMKPTGFTERLCHWSYICDQSSARNTNEILARTFDMRLPEIPEHFEVETFTNLLRLAVSRFKCNGR